MPDIDGMADQLFSALDAYVERRFVSLTKRCEDLEQKLAKLPAPQNGKDADEDAVVARVLAAIPAPKDGKDGTDGVDGAAGEKGADGVNGKDADEDAIVARVLAAIPAPKDGAPGADGKIGSPGANGQNGKDADEEAIVARVLKAIPVPKDGKDGAAGANGKDFDPADMLEAVTKAVAALPKPKDGESIHPDTVALMVREAVDTAVTKAVAGIRAPKDGEPGRDATHVEILPAIDVAKSYPRGTWARYAGGTIMAARSTDPITSTIAAAGWEVMLNGIAEELEREIDERTIERTTTYTNGEKMVRSYVSKAMIYRKVWREGEYRRGDTVTVGGSTWHCDADVTTERPGTGEAWTLAVKRGRDGADGVMKETKEAVIRVR